MATHRIARKAAALRELKRIGREVAGETVGTGESLGDDPYAAGVKKLQGTDQTYRLRVGDYRLPYEVYRSFVHIQIIQVRHRKDISGY